MDKLTHIARSGRSDFAPRSHRVRGAAAGLAAAIGPRGAFAAGPDIVAESRLHQPAHRRARRLRRNGRLHPRPRAQGAGAGAQGRRQDLSRSIFSISDTQSDPSRAGQLAKTLINSDKIDMMLCVSTPETINPVADACEAAGVPCLSTVMPWEAWYFGRGAKPGAAFALQMDLPLRLRRRRILQDLCLAMEPPADQQEGRRALSERRGRQRDPRRISRRLSRRPASRSSTRAPTRTARPTFPRRSPSSRRRSARSSTPSRSRPTSPPSGGRPPSRATRRWSRSPRSPRPACFPVRSRRSALSAPISRARPIGTRPSPTSLR